uniref:ATP-dependent Clp protease proteolytic subunit n=1 Tax=Attheya septentrionalis TaxID=420275 RepID=A0A7S2XQD6_9STRA|mmetsp:Transcript_29205/g.53437  ORF Transcript_29205/g.53437 Transcript_29205/m.53437 type:complete len:282 (+) Transcript_29205:84-929(+)
MKLTCLVCLVGSAAAFSAVRQQHGARSTALNGAGNMDLWGGKNSLYTSSTNSIRMMPEEPEPEVDPRRKNPDDAPPPAPVRMPVIDTESGQMDVISRLLKDRILLLGQGVDDEVANVLVAQLLYLANEDPTKDITLYINSPGGSVSAGLAIYDTMQFIPCDVTTVCFGMAASMGAFLLGAGAPGKRKSLPNARIMIHQPLGGAQGQAADIEIQAKEILFIKASLNKFMADYCDQPVEKIAQDTDRDFFMTPYEALDYGIIDEVIKTKTSHIPLPPMPSLRN